MSEAAGGHRGGASASRFAASPDWDRTGGRSQSGAVDDTRAMTAPSPRLDQAGTVLALMVRDSAEEWQMILGGFR
jgi:hypothetical protein